MAELLDGKALAKEIETSIKKIVSELDHKPGLGVVLVGQDKASHIYVSGKEKACKSAGIVSKKILLDHDTTLGEVLKKVDELNQDEDIHGFIVQLPLPNHIDEQLIIDGILPHKDADGFSPISLGRLLLGQESIRPATPKGIMRLLKHYEIPLEGKHAVVVGRSNIVGKPIALLLQQEHCTVTMCHSKTKDLKKFTQDADILIVSVGKAHLITKDMVKKGVVVVDVGMNRLDDGALVGDVDFKGVSKKASYITPVPGGVGPMTIAMVLENCLECYKLQKNL